MFARIFSRMPGPTHGRTCTRRRPTGGLKQDLRVGQAQAPLAGPLGRSWVLRPTRRRVACRPVLPPGRSWVPLQRPSRMPTSRPHSRPACRSVPSSFRSQTRPMRRRARQRRGRTCSLRRPVRCPLEVHRQTLARPRVRDSRVRATCLPLSPARRRSLSPRRSRLVQILARLQHPGSRLRATCPRASPARRRSLLPRRSHLVQILARLQHRGSRVRATCLRLSPARRRSPSPRRSLLPRRSRSVPTLARRVLADSLRRRRLVSSLRRRLLAGSLQCQVAVRLDSPRRRSLGLQEIQAAPLGPCRRQAAQEVHPGTQHPHLWRTRSQLQMVHPRAPLVRSQPHPGQHPAAQRDQCRRHRRLSTAPAALAIRLMSQQQALQRAEPIPPARQALQMCQRPARLGRQAAHLRGVQSAAQRLLSRKQ